MESLLDHVAGYGSVTCSWSLYFKAALTGHRRELQQRNQLAARFSAAKERREQRFKKSSLLVFFCG